jgi:phosphonate transport system substrate-binding protein
MNTNIKGGTMSHFSLIVHTRRVIFICLVLCLCSSALFAADQKTYTLAVIPNMPAVTLHKNWTPLAEHLSKELGVRIELKLYDKIATFLDETQAGQADLIYSAPNMFFLAYQKQKYTPLVRSSNMLRGRVFVRKDSPYTRVSELKGKNIAFVGPKNVCSVITRHALLSGQGGIDFNSSFSGSTINVAKSVMLGKADAGATLDISMMTDIPEMVNEFRILLETEEVAPHPLAAHPRVPKKLQERLTAVVLALNGSEKGRAMLEAVKLAKPVKADYRRDYSFFANVDFERLDKQAK